MSQGAKGDPGLSPGQAPKGEPVNNTQIQTTTTSLSGALKCLCIQNRKLQQSHQPISWPLRG